jgi:hypothetical protein
MGPVKILLMIGLAVFTVVSCGPKYVTVSTIPDVNQELLERVAILPLAVEDGLDTAGRTMKTGRVEKGGALIITALLYQKLADYRQLEVLQRGTVDPVVERIRSEEPESSLEELARRVGRELGVATVLAGRVNTFVERVGRAYGIERPASVGFDLFLISVIEGVILWKGSYYETQQSLFSDITSLPLFLKRKGRWLTAMELSTYGSEQVLSGSPWAKAD